MKTLQEEVQKTSNAISNNVIFISNNQQAIKKEAKSVNKISPQNSIITKSNRLPKKDIRSNKFNIKSPLNNPSPNKVTNVSLNEQILHKKKEHSDYFENEILFQGGEESDPLFKEYTMINDKKNKAIDDIKNMSERIKNNNIKIEEIKKNLINLKEEKKQKQNDIINLLSNKESIEEIYKNQIYSLNANPTRGRIININNSNNNNAINATKKNGDKSKTTPNTNKNSTNLINNNLDNQTNNDEETFKITLNEIKESDQKKYTEQAINMFEDIFKKKDKKLNSVITKIVKSSYQSFETTINKENTNDSNNENNNELIITNFFKKLSLFISNHSLGRFCESKINLFLRYLLKINAISVKLTQYIKFVNKKYKERKKELNDMLSFLEKKNINLNEKNNRLENNMKEFDNKLDFFEKNDLFDFEKNSYNSNEGIYDIDKKRKIKRNNLLKNPNKKKDSENEEQLSHDVVIEYEDGIDQNVEINYEDDLANDYDYEKEKEMINQGLNPYKNDGNIINKDDKNKTINKPPLGNAITSVFVDNRTNLQPTKILDENELKKLSAIELEHYNRVQRIMNSGPKVNNIFGVNNYNPENNISAGKDSTFSPRKNIGNGSNSNNKIDKTIKIGSRQNHNFVSVINKTKFVPPKKKDKEKNNKTKDKSKRSKQNEGNDGVIKVINLEENFLSEIKAEEANENENDIDNKTGNESTSHQTNNNNSNKNNINEINETDDISKTNKNFTKKINNKINNTKTVNINNNTKSVNISNKNINNNIIINNINNNINNSSNINNIISSANNNNNNIIIKSAGNVNNKNEFQGYYLNLAKNLHKENGNEEGKEINTPTLIEFERKDNINLINENSVNNNGFFASNKRTLKITKSRELNINDIKKNKIGKITKKVATKTQNPKKMGKPKTKLILMKNTDNKEAFPLNNSLQRPKTNNSLNKNGAFKKISTSMLDNTTGSNYFTFNNNVAKRSLSVTENAPISHEEGVNRQYNNTTTFIMSSNNSINASLNKSKNRKIGIPKVKSQNYNSNTFEGSLKREVNIKKNIKI